MAEQPTRLSNRHVPGPGLGFTLGPVGRPGPRGFRVGLRGFRPRVVINTDTATRPGAFRIWVKLTTSTMDNLEADEADHRYSMEDVPYVQFFDKAIALHGVFWHSDFGHVHSHGCVNLAPADARWLFRFTGPKLGAGMAAILPAPNDKGTVVRVR